MTQPIVWTAEQLTSDATTSAANFREQRLSGAGEWQLHYEQSRAKFERLFECLDNLNPESINTESLAEVIRNGLTEALRYLSGPPVSDDDLQVIADVSSMAPSRLANDDESLARVFSIIERIIDPYRFPWVQQNRTPTEGERDAALLASSVLLAAQRLASERRNNGKDAQEGAVKDYLRSIGFIEVPAARIETLVQGPQEGQFCPECQLGERKADVVVRLHDTRLLAIECKVSNSEVNSVKRLNNDAVAKAEYWTHQFGQALVPSAMLSGVFKVLNMQQAQMRGLYLFWAHDLVKLGDFIGATKPPSGGARRRRR